MDGITDSMDLSLSKLQETVKHREVCHAIVRGAAKESGGQRIGVSALASVLPKNIQD